VSGSDTPLVEARGAARWYGQVIALSDVTLTLGPGVTGLLGPNGAGKSTLMKLLVGQLRPSRGEVRVLGESVFGNRRVLRHLGYSPEHENTYDELTGLELGTFLNRLHGIDPGEAERRARAMLERLDLGEAMHQRLGTYSKGMRQRAKLAQAMAHDPEVLFLDEPLTGCDPLSRVKVLEVVRDCARRGACVVMSSHVLYEIEALTRNIVLLYRGKVLAEGEVSAIRDLIDRHPHRVRITCDRPRLLGARLVERAEVQAVSFEPDGATVTVETRAPDALYPEVPRLARAHGVTLLGLTSPDDNLAAVFRYLTEDRERPGAAAASTQRTTTGASPAARRGPR
jgi:ABC-2 type transport system ATP-binding protein